jgi:hypothetical protein
MLVQIMTSRNKQSPMEQKPRSALAVDLAPISQEQDGNDDLFVLFSQITRQSPTRTHWWPLTRRAVSGFSDRPRAD